MLCAAWTCAAVAQERTDDVFTIQCMTFQGADRALRVKNCMDSLKSARGIKNSLVQSIDRGNGETAVCYGKYVRTFDGKNGKEMYKPDPQADLNLIRQFSVDANTSAGKQTSWPFRLATIVELPGPPSKHPEWDLKKAKGYWSLQVAVFYNTPEMQARRYAAEEWCKALRDEGYEAYYDHGAVHSCVFVGAFPKEAIQNYTKKDPLTGVQQVTAKIVDPKMLELQTKQPYHAENGQKISDITRDPKTGEKKRDPHTSFPVQIPGAEQNTPAKESKRRGP
jgi:hypothetical protein